MAERTSNWEPVNSEPAVYRHRGRGSLWVVGQQLVYLPSASLSDVIALMKSVGEIGKPVVVVEPVKLQNLLRPRRRATSDGDQRLEKITGE